MRSAAFSVAEISTSIFDIPGLRPLTRLPPHSSRDAKCRCQYRKRTLTPAACALAKAAGHVVAHAYRFFANFRREKIAFYRHRRDGFSCEQRWYKVGTCLFEEFDRTWSCVGPVLNAGNTSFEGGYNAVFVMCVRGDFPPHLALPPETISRSSSISICCPVPGGALGHYPARRCDFDEITAVFDDVACGASAIVRSVADVWRREHFEQVGLYATDVCVAAGNSDTTRRNDSGPVDPAVVDRIAQCVHFLSAGANVAHRCKSRSQCVHRVVDAGASASVGRTSSANRDRCVVRVHPEDGRACPSGQAVQICRAGR